MTPSEWALAFVQKRYGECVPVDHNHLWCRTHSSYYPRGTVCRALTKVVSDITAAIEAYREEPEHITVTSWPYRPTAPKENP